MLGYLRLCFQNDGRAARPTVIRVKNGRTKGEWTRARITAEVKRDNTIHDCHDLNFDVWSQIVGTDVCLGIVNQCLKCLLSLNANDSRQRTKQRNEDLLSSSHL